MADTLYRLGPGANPRRQLRGKCGSWANIVAADDQVERHTNQNKRLPAPCPLSGAWPTLLMAELGAIVPEMVVCPG
jgi:hypothetical protein